MQVRLAQPGAIGNTEQEEVAYCTKSGRGTRLIPEGTLKGVHFVKTPDYVQVTGVGDFTKINVLKGDSGGELDDRGANGKHTKVSFWRILLMECIGKGNPSKQPTSFVPSAVFINEPQLVDLYMATRLVLLCNTMNGRVSSRIPSFASELA